MFEKLCQKCGSSIQGARNLQFCSNCKWKKPRKPAYEFRWTFNESALDDKEFRSYLTGFLYTDGSVGLLKDGSIGRVGWYSSDLQIIQDITTRLGYSKPNYLVSPKGKGEWGNYLTGSYARYVVDRLGIEKDKEDHTLERRDVDLYHFLRGHLDGEGSIDLRELRDGTIVLNTVTFLTRSKLAYELKCVLENEGFSDVSCKSTKCKNGRVKQLYKVSLGSTRGEKLLTLLYASATIFLERKRALYHKIVR